MARPRQGAGRHDSPARYGAWYCSRAPVSAVAESIKFLRGESLTDEDFRRVDGVAKALVGFSVADDLELTDLDDPSQLMLRNLRPSQVATLRRAATQRLAISIFDEGAAGLLWWSTLEAEWTNVTLFYERALPRVSHVSPPVTLSTRLPEVQEAADRLGIRI